MSESHTFNIGLCGFGTVGQGVWKHLTTHRAELEARLGENMELTRRGVAAEIAAYLATEGLPTAVPAQMDSAALLELMMRDKKVVGGRLAMSLLSDIGACKLVRDIPNEAVLEVLTP